MVFFDVGSPFRVRLVGNALDVGENVPRPTPKDTQATGLGVIAEDDEDGEEVTEVCCGCCCCCC